MFIEHIGFSPLRDKSLYCPSFRSLFINLSDMLSTTWVQVLSVHGSFSLICFHRLEWTMIVLLVDRLLGICNYVRNTSLVIHLKGKVRGFEDFYFSCNLIIRLNCLQQWQCLGSLPRCFLLATIVQHTAELVSILS